MNIKFQDLQGLGNTLNAVRHIAGKTARWKIAVAKNFKLVAAEAQTLEETRNAICKDHCLKDEDDKPILRKTDDGEVYTFQPEEEEAVNEKIAELMDETVDLPIMLLGPEDIPDELLPFDVAGLLPMIKDETNNDKE